MKVVYRNRPLVDWYGPAPRVALERRAIRRRPWHRQHGSILIASHIDDFVPNPAQALTYYDPAAEAIQEHAEQVWERLGKRLPADIKARLGKERPSWADLVTASDVKWRDVLTVARVIAADGAQVLNTITETIMCPDFTFVADAVERGDLFEYTLCGNISTVLTTPGTIIFRLRWGGIGGVQLAASGAFAPDPTAAATTLSYKVIWHVAVRNDGATGSMFAFAEIEWNDYDDASATTLKSNLDMKLAPVSAPAAVTVDTTSAKALTPSVAFSVATATTQLTNNLSQLESLN